MAIINISGHAWERWRERMRHKSPFGLRHELSQAKRIKRNQCHSAGIRFERGNRYYMSDTCVFVVKANSKTLITLWRRT